MQSITVKYLPATNYCPARLKARCAGGSITVALDYSIDDRDYLVERTVALALIAKMDWGQQVRITGVGRDYRGDVVFTLGNIETDSTSKRDRTPLALIENDPRRLADLETDSTSKRDRWIEQARQSEIPTEYQEFLIRHYDKTQQYADATPVEYMRRHFGDSCVSRVHVNPHHATVLRDMLDLDEGAGVIVLDELAPIGGDES